MRYGFTILVGNARRSWACFVKKSVGKVWDFPFINEYANKKPLADALFARGFINWGSRIRT